MHCAYVVMGREVEKCKDGLSNSYVQYGMAVSTLSVHLKNVRMQLRKTKVAITKLSGFY